MSFFINFRPPFFANRILSHLQPLTMNGYESYVI
jgi:hypothetical protein